MFVLCDCDDWLNKCYNWIRWGLFMFGFRGKSDCFWECVFDIENGIGC